jgi:hypothetical protein
MKFLVEFWDWEIQELEAASLFSWIISVLVIVLSLIYDFSVTKLIILITLSILLGELFFIGLCKYRTNKRYNDSSFLVGIKIGALFHGIVFSGYLLILYYIFKTMLDITKNYGYNLLIVIGIITVIVIFFWLNVLLAKHIRRNKNGKTKSKRRKK